MDETISRIKVGIFGILVTILCLCAYNTVFAHKSVNNKGDLSFHDRHYGVLLRYELVMSNTPNNKADLEQETHSENDAQDTKEYIIYDVPLDNNLQMYISDLCDEYNVPMTIVLSLIKHESTYREDVISSTNDYGLMQINRGNHEWIMQDLGISDFLDPYDNVYAGIYMLSFLFENYQNEHLALMAYNMGSSKAKQLWANGTVSSNYSRKIVNYADELERINYE